jgi:glycosyltransferase involved in cell wall biosynthesis/peptidoglycan/xylan/chitin deacetylase (PgdA/CDA1 family)
MSFSVSKQSPHKIVCVCGGLGFPFGSASAARITMVGRTLQEAGIHFEVLHCGPSPVAINTQTSGVHMGIPFAYTTALRRPKNVLLRVLVYLRGAIGLTARLIQMRPNRRNLAVYLYVMDGMLVLYAGFLCRVLGIPLIQELCEWWPGEPACSRFTRWIYNNGAIFKHAIGVLVISRAIEERCAEASASLLLHRLPSIVDARRFATAAVLKDEQQPPTFVYCTAGWLKDIYFLVRVFALVKQQGYECRLKVVGPCGGDNRALIQAYAAERGIQERDLEIAGLVDEAALESGYKSAAALLMPLWSDDRSITRLPNKLGEYLASGRPVISCRIGDLTEFLLEDVNVYLANPGDESDFAGKMIAVLQNPQRANEIGAAGQRACMAYLDYRTHVRGLAQFMTRCITHPHLPGRKRQHHPLLSTLRNSFCGLLALGVIASGRAGAARKRALSTGVVTPVYFHNPSRRLFKRCVEWLIKSGYKFISLDELHEILKGDMTPPPGAVWLSFDDGFKEMLQNVIPVVRKHKIPITLFVPSGIVEHGGRFPWLHRNTDTDPARRDSLTVEQLKQVAAYPEVTIGSHTVNHTVTASLAEEAMRFEFEESKRRLEEWTGREVKSFAYPEGRYDGPGRQLLAECGYKVATTTQVAFINGSTDPFLVPRFNVGDDISFSEAICNMTGQWRPVIDPLIDVMKRWSTITRLIWTPAGRVRGGAHITDSRSAL